MGNRSADWFRQAECDLEQAKESRHSGRHEWACFAAQQAAEKAVRALHLSLNQEAWGHIIRKPLQELPSGFALPESMIDKARILDALYVPTRYANGHPEGAPFENYGSLQSGEAIKHAGEIVEFCRTQMARSKNRC